MIHLVYVTGDAISTPTAIANELSARLARHHDVRVYDWDSSATIVPGVGDILIGHPHPSPNTLFRNSFRNGKWGRRVVLCPFAHALPEYIAFLDPLILQSDLYLAICGRYWFDTLSGSLFRDWAPKMERLDLAVNIQHFPRIKHRFAPAGRRRFLYIGHPSYNKGFDYFSSLAELNPDMHFGWIGHGHSPSPRIQAHGPRDFSKPEDREIVSSYDFLLTCGRSDANPTTVLEAAAWGLIPICTPQSGYHGETWYVNIPLDSPWEASRVLRQLNNASESELAARQEESWSAINAHYNWDRFSTQVLEAITAQRPAVRANLSDGLDYIRRRIAIRCCAFRSFTGGPFQGYAPLSVRRARRVARLGAAMARAISRRCGGVFINV